MVQHCAQQKLQLGSILLCSVPALSSCICCLVWNYLETFLTLKVLTMTVDDWNTFKQDNCNTVGGDGGCRVGEVRACTISPII